VLFYLASVDARNKQKEYELPIKAFAWLGGQYFSSRSNPDFSRGIWQKAVFWGITEFPRSL
jgi:hypothetical protein